MTYTIKDYYTQATLATKVINPEQWCDDNDYLYHHRQNNVVYAIR